MEGLGGASVQLSLDCEDMFKEITKKLYGEEGALEFPAAERHDERHELPVSHPDHDLRPEEHITAFGLAALMQNGFPPPGILQANFAPRLEPGAEDHWSAAEEPLAWAASRVASYNPAQRLFKCADCECVGFLSRVAEHWLGTHASARVFSCPQCAYSSSWARCLRAHLARDHALPPQAHDPLLHDNPALQDLTRYLQRLKAKVDARKLQPASAPPAPPTAPAPAPAPAPALTKRYACAACPYATDRRDLFTRHENIHREHKPFHCYVCHKHFNRADHVKKHFLRMHRDHAYDLHRIRRPDHPAHPAHPDAKPAHADHPAHAAPSTHLAAAPVPVPVSVLSLPVADASPRSQPEQRAASPGGGSGGGGGAGSAAARRRGERRYACCYCSWAGSDNWCLKRHLNTHLKPFACALCEYRAARAERLATHLQRVHHKRACSRCAFLADDAHQLHAHAHHAHHAPPPPRAALRVPAPPPTGGAASVGAQHAGAAAARGRRGGRAQGAARLFGYLEASDEEAEGAGGVNGVGGLAGSVGVGGVVGGGGMFGAQFSSEAPRDKENAAPADCLVRY